MGSQEKKRTMLRHVKGVTDLSKLSEKNTTIMTHTKNVVYVPPGFLRPSSFSTANLELHLEGTGDRPLFEKSEGRKQGFFIMTSQRTIEHDTRMSNEVHRVLSFGSFPGESVVSPEKLAKNGFYYSRSDGKIVCYCCGLRIDTRAEGESEPDAHRRLSPHCNFICGREHGYIPNRNDDHTQNIDSNEQTVQRTNSSFANERNESYLGTTCGKGKWPKYERKRDRMKSFQEWPFQQVIDRSQLADAGFFFTGIGDYVRCFCCGGGLKNWDNGDVQLVEQARWFPYCLYAQHCKREFENVYRAPAHSGYPLMNESQPVQSQECSSNSQDRFITDVHGIAAQLVLAMGYSQTDVEMAISFVRSNYGDVDMNVHLIMEYMRAANCEISALERDRRRNSLTYGDLDINHASCDPLNTMPTNIPHSSVQSVPVEHADEIHVPPDLPQPNLVDNNCKDILPAETLNLAITYMEETQRETEQREQLVRENRRLNELTTCKICLQNEVSIVFLPCGHLVSCGVCAIRLTTCAICRATIQRKVEIV